MSRSPRRVAGTRGLRGAIPDRVGASGSGGCGAIAAVVSDGRRRARAAERYRSSGLFVCAGAEERGTGPGLLSDQEPKETKRRAVGLWQIRVRSRVRTYLTTYVGVDGHRIRTVPSASGLQLLHF